MPVFIIFMHYLPRTLIRMLSYRITHNCKVAPKCAAAACWLAISQSTRKAVTPKVVFYRSTCLAMEICFATLQGNRSIYEI